MDNRYLRDKARRRMRRDRMAYDHRSRGRMRDSRADYTEYDRRGLGRSDYEPYDGTYDRYSEHHGQYMYPTTYGVGHYIYGPDGKDYDDAKEYHKELEDWMNKLKRHDRFNLRKEDVLRKAKEMNVQFRDFDEMEFYVTYLMMLSDFKQISNDPHQYLIMAKEWLEDNDVKRSGSEKLCAYLYTIVLGEDDD